MLDPSRLFQANSTPQSNPLARPQPTNPLKPTGLPFGSPQVRGMQADGLSVSQILSQSQPVPQSAPLQAITPWPADENSYPEALPSNMIRESVVTKLVFAMKSPLQLFNRQDPDTIINTGHKDVKGNPIRLARDAAAGMEKIYAEAKSRGLSLRVVSTYRSVEQQKYLWEKALKKYGSEAAARKWVAPPGKSRHNSGKAIDVYMYRNGKQIPQQEFDEVIAKAGMYRPMSWEGWHIEPLSTKKGRGK